MKVAVRNKDENHPNHGWFAFEQGRISGHRDPITGEAFTQQQVADALLARALVEFPEDKGYEHRLETLHEDGWHVAGESDVPLAADGGVVEHDLEAAQGQEAENEV